MTGFIKIMMDAPGDRHPHQATYAGEKIDGCEAFYKNMALKLLHAAEFRSLNFLKLAEWIVKSGTTVFEERDAYERTARNTKLRTWGQVDVRRDPAYAAGAKVDGDKRVVDVLRGWWLPEGSAGKLHRKMWMHMSRQEEMLQFPAHNLASEVEYAISRIREV